MDKFEAWCRDKAHEEWKKSMTHVQESFAAAADARSKAFLECAEKYKALNTVS